MAGKSRYSLARLTVAGEKNVVANPNRKSDLGPNTAQGVLPKARGSYPGPRDGLRDGLGSSRILAVLVHQHRGQLGLELTKPLSQMVLRPAADRLPHPAPPCPWRRLHSQICSLIVLPSSSMVLIFCDSTAPQMRHVGGKRSVAQLTGPYMVYWRNMGNYLFLLLLSVQAVARGST
jgi:hypothetical protein